MKIFVGWDSREDIAYQVCRSSIIRRRDSAEVIPLKQDELREQGIYTREVDPMSSTEFTFTRFLVPYLMNYEGWAIFCDCDFLFLEDVKHLFDLKDERYAVMVVKHDYNPPAGTKMDGQQQLPYPRKNWSSLMLINCGHPKNKQGLTPQQVNLQDGQFLHRFSWLEDHEIGDISHQWNWLVGHYKQPQNGIPMAIHYTEGGPWFDNYAHCEYGALWERERNVYEHSLISPPIPHKYAHLPPAINSVIDKLIEYRVDPKNEYYSTTKETLLEEIDKVQNNNIQAIDSEFRYAEKGAVYDPWLYGFIMGSGGQITTYSKVENDTTPVVIRGIAKRKQIHDCWEKKRDFYYIDTGYFGNGKKKTYHRCTKNHLQNIYPVIERPADRFERCGVKLKKFRPGRDILVCPPSAKVMAFFDLDLEQWMEETVNTIKQHTDRPIVIRLKQGRSARVHTNTLAQALDNNVHCLVTFNSIAATEALLLGKPAITLGPNAAHSLCSKSLAEIERPYIPSKDEVFNWACHLAYSQFTELEMRDGTAWGILSENSNISGSST